MNQVESRPLRYFVAVAQELNFARAAERLGIAPPALSRAIAQLERRLDVKLLERSTRRVELTAPGRVLLDQAQLALEALDAATRRAQRAAEPEHRLIVALKADLDGDLLERTIAAYDRERAAVPIEVALGGWGEQPRQLREGRADVALVYAPFDERELDFEVLLEEPRVAALVPGHPLASRPFLSVADLETDYEPMPGFYIWHRRASRWLGQQPSGVGGISQLLGHVELGQLIALLPASVASRFQRPQITYRPVPDAPPATLSVAWPRSSHSLATAAFVRVITQLAATDRVLLKAVSQEPSAPGVTGPRRSRLSTLSSSS